MIRAGLHIAGKYRVVRKLGEGAMGSVWLAVNEITEREFAIKVLLPTAAAAPAALGRFFQEAKVCGTLRHPAILEIYDAGTAPELDGAPYLVMERLDGAALDVVLKERGKLGVALALDIVAQIARGLEKAHAKGVIHRDLKPANIFLHRPGAGTVEPKVLDFGISKVVVQNTPSVKFTETSAVVGSPLYMSPEQLAADRALDGRSDVHALGVVLWECLAGSAPFTTTSYNLMVVEVLKGPRPFLRHVVTDIPTGVDEVMTRAFAIDRDDRFPSAAALADALEAELAKLGGSVLASRSAAAEILGELTLGSKAPPPYVPPSSDFDAGETGDLPPRVMRSTLASTPVVSLADTELPLTASDPHVAPPTLPEPAVAVSAIAVSSERLPTPKPRRGASLVTGLVAASVVVAGFLFLRHGSPEPPMATPAAVTTVPATAPPPVAETAPLPEPTVATVPSVPSASPPPSASAEPPAAPAPHPKVTQSGLPAPRPVTHRPRIDQPGIAPSARPRIDQSGL